MEKNGRTAGLNADDERGLHPPFALATGWVSGAAMADASSAQALGAMMRSG